MTRRASRNGLVQLSPIFFTTSFLLLVPLLILITYSFRTQHGFTIDNTFTLSNYKEFFENPYYFKLLFRSIIIGAVATALVVLLAYPVAYFIAFRAKHKIIWLVLITAPFWTSYLLRVFSWKVILGYQGVINSILMSIGIIDEPLHNLMYSPFAVVVTLAHAWAPFAIMPIYVSLEKLDRRLLDASRDLGESALATFWRVTLPLSRPGLIAACVIVFIPTVGDYVTPELVGGRSGAMIGSMIQLLFGKLNNWPMGAAVAIVSMTVVTAIICGIIWMLPTINKSVAK